MASAMAGSVPDGGGADGGTASTEDRSPQTFIVDDSGGHAFLTIQAAIDAASPGDLVRVYAGSYRENVTIDKGVHLVGNGTDTYISNDGTRDVITVLSSRFVIRGFSISCPFKYAGIKLDHVDNGLIENCDIRSGGGTGIRGDDGCDNITIMNNTFYRVRYQAVLLGGNGNLIENNSFFENRIGVSIHGNGNRIINNVFEEDDYGVRLGHFSQDVLLMGNSYTYANSLDEIVEGQLDTITTDAVASSLAAGGLTLSDHATRVQTSGHTWNTTLNDGRTWEAVVLQDQSQIPGFPTAQTSWQRSMSAARVLDAMIERRGADTVFLMTWGRRDGDSTNPGLYPNFTVMQARLEAGYGYYAENISTDDRPAYIAPVGLAFKHVHDDIIAGGGDPTAQGTMFYDLYQGDGSHPSRQGSYLASCVLYATLTGNTPVGLQDRITINALRKLALQEAAAATVFNETPGYKYPWRRSTGNLVDGNTFEVQGTGLTIGCNADGNIVSNNSFSGGYGPGVLVRDANSKGNTIHHNGFRKNHMGQARDDRNVNTWDDGSEGNYWSDYISRYPGATHDGVVWDTPYDIVGGGADRYPLVRFPAFEDLDPPEAFAGLDRTEDEGTLVELDGQGSYDAVGIVNYTWTFEYDGESVVLYGPLVEYQFDVPGVYNVTLNVTDGAGNWGVDHIVLTILDTTKPTAWMTPLGPVDQHERFTLNGSRSYDNVGIVNWTWRFFSDRGDVFLYGEVAELVVGTAGRYYILLKVFDAAGNNGTEGRYFMVRDIDPPVADAGPDRSIDQGQFVTLDGFRSWDNVGIASYMWTIEGGDGNIEGKRVNHLFVDPGQFFVTLTVEDDAGNSASDTINVTVRDIEPPVADAGGDRTVDQGKTFTLNGYGSTDNDGIYWFIWTNSLHPNSIHEEAIFKLMISSAGVFTFTLTVRDAAGNEDSASITITVRDTTNPEAFPVEVRSADQGSEVTLDGSASTDNVGIVDWRWTIVYDGLTSYMDGENVSFTFDVPGDAVITLMVTDAVGLTDQVTFDLHVRDTIPPIPPSLEDLDVEVGERVDLVASGGTDNVGIVSWTWTIEGGRETVVLEGKEVDHVFDEPGEYAVTLTVEDAEGNSAQESFTVTVEGTDWSFVALLIALAVLIVLFVYFMRRPAKDDGA